jgi:hypothetical protein
MYVITFLVPQRHLMWRCGLYFTKMDLEREAGPSSRNDHLNRSVACHSALYTTLAHDDLVLINNGSGISIVAQVSVLSCFACPASAGCAIW